MSASASLEEVLMMEMSRRNTDMIVEIITREPALFDQMFKIFLEGKDPVNRRAAWAIDIYTETHTTCLHPYLSSILVKLPDFDHDGLKRHALRMVLRCPLPADEQLGGLMNTCFEWLLSPREAVAAKVHCMDILYRISQKEPDLKMELADSIEWRLNEETPGFKNKGLKLLSKLYPEIEMLKRK